MTIKGKQNSVLAGRCALSDVLVPFEHFCVVFVFPGFVRGLDLGFDLAEGVVEHLGELGLELIDLLSEICDFLVHVVLHLAGVLDNRFLFLRQTLKLLLVARHLALQVCLLTHQLVLGCFILPCHVRNDVLLSLLFFLEGGPVDLVVRFDVTLLGDLNIALLLLADEAHLERLDFCLQNEVLLGRVDIISDATLLFLALSLALLLGCHY